MTRSIRIITAAALAVALGMPCAAQDVLAKRVSLDLKAMAPADAFKVIAQAIGYTVDVAPDVTTPVDIVVRNVRAKTALDTICESIGCSWRATGTVIAVRAADALAVAVSERKARGSRAEAARAPAERLRAGRAEAVRARAERLKIRIDRKLPADMTFENAPLQQVAERLSKATGLEVTISGDMPPGQTFSADLSNRPFSAALTALSQQLKGDVVCRIGLQKDEAGGDQPRIAIQIRAKRK